MFTLLDGINHLLGYFNFNLRLKNKIYTIVGFVANCYVGYLALKFFAYHAYWRGLLYSGIFIIFLYFLILNFIYYFTNKKVNWDISEKIATILGEHH